MRVYLASRFGRRKEMRKYATDLGNLGHSVTSGWVFEEAHDGLDATLGKGTHDDFWQQIGEDDALDILGSDMLIQFTDGVRSPGGKMVPSSDKTVASGPPSINNCRSPPSSIKIESPCPTS